MGLVRTELLKLRTQRAMVVMLAFAVVLPLSRFLLVGLGAVRSDVAGFDLASEALQRGQLFETGGGTVLVVVLAILGITGEYRHKTITWAFLATPERHKVLLTKFAVYVLIGALYGVVVAALVTAAVLSLLAIEGVGLAIGWDVILADYGKEIAGIAMSVGLAFSVGALVVNQIAAILIVVLEPIVSTLVMGLLPEVGRYLPGPALGAAMGEQTFVFEQFLSRPVALLVLAGYLIVLNGVAIYLTQRRDIT